MVFVGIYWEASQLSLGVSNGSIIRLLGDFFRAVSQVFSGIFQGGIIGFLGEL